MSYITPTFHPRIIMFYLMILVAAQANADIFKWIRNEAIPTISGSRPIEIKPYISIKSGSNQIRFGEDSAMIKIGSVTVQTGKLKLRLAQAGCIYLTGDVIRCAPDVIDREANKLFEEIAKPVKYENKKKHSSDTITFTDFNGQEINWDSPKASIGYDFSNPGAAPSKPSPSAFIHNLVVKRDKDEKAKATVEIVGRTDFAFMDGKKGGVLCLFASEKGRYLRDHNDQYRDQYGIVAIGSSIIVNETPTFMQIQLSMPWSELELPDDVNPYNTQYVKCHVTVDDTSMQETEWIPF